MSVCVVYRELLEEGKHILAQAEIVDAECDAWLLLEHVSGMNRAQFFLHQQDTVPDELEADSETGYRASGGEAVAAYTGETGTRCVYRFRLYCDIVSRAWKAEADGRSGSF